MNLDGITSQGAEMLSRSDDKCNNVTKFRYLKISSDIACDSEDKQVSFDVESEPKSTHLGRFH